MWIYKIHIQPITPKIYMLQYINIFVNTLYSSSEALQSTISNYKVDRHKFPESTPSRIQKTEFFTIKYA
jgi:hypothetical protein